MLSEAIKILSLSLSPEHYDFISSLPCDVDVYLAYIRQVTEMRCVYLTLHLWCVYLTLLCIRASLYIFAGRIFSLLSNTIGFNIIIWET